MAKAYTSICPCYKCKDRTENCHKRGMCTNSTLTYEEWLKTGIEEPTSRNWHTPGREKRKREYQRSRRR